MNNEECQTQLERKVQKVLSPFQEFIRTQVAASLFLVACTVLAVFWASTPSIAPFYEKFIKTQLGFSLSSFHYVKSLQFWINDVLLTLFFFFVGLEIKRELLVGELNDRKSIIIVIIASLGGMLVPALLFYVFNYHTALVKGWGIPMATDTAFALGVAVCFKSRLPHSAISFLAAVAIIDDIGAIVVIALFYTSTVNIIALLVAVIMFLVLIFLNYAGSRRPLVYLFFGLLLWAALEKSGVHGTVAGIACAMTIPARPRKTPKQFVKHAESLISYVKQRKEANISTLEDKKQHKAIEEMQVAAQQATTPLQRWESRLELPIALIVLPLFALVNAGVKIHTQLLSELFENYFSIGIFLGLVIGKPLGIMLFSKLAQIIRLGNLPGGMKFNELWRFTFLTGIGFTMSIFMSTLSLNNAHDLQLAKCAIIVASLISAILAIVFMLCSKNHSLYSESK